MIMPSIDPVAFYLFGWPVRWYGLSYAVAFLLASYFLKYFKSAYAKMYSNPEYNIENKHLDNIITFGILGVILGGRLGHMFFYDFHNMVTNPVSIFKTWEGGMAFHGGLVGCVLAAYIYVRKNKLPVALLADLIAFVTPLGIFCVRLANFVNQELYGRVTDLPFGIIFKGETLPRHPSQLYEAFLEGPLLFFMMYWFFKKKLNPCNQGMLCSIFFTGYGFSRFLVEYVREPSDGEFNILGIILTYGQILTLPMIIYGLFYMLFIQKSKSSTY